MTATTPLTTIPRPGADEHSPYYATYISLVPDGNLIEMLQEQQQETVALLRGLSEKQALHAYAPGKWTIKEVVGHLSDGERIFCYRALRFARDDKQPLPGFEENAYVPAGRFNSRTLGDLVAEFVAVRAATVHLFRNLNETELARMGVANDNPITVRAIAYIIAGHERHHLGILRERYLKSR
jgi:DinB superfamily